MNKTDEEKIEEPKKKPAKSIDDKIKNLKESLKKAELLKRQQEARKRSAEAKTIRADETRRKFLAGSLILKLAEESEETKEKFWKKLDIFLTRNDDRKLFELPAIEQPPPVTMEDLRPMTKEEFNAIPQYPRKQPKSKPSKSITAKDDQLWATKRSNA